MFLAEKTGLIQQSGGEPVPGPSIGRAVSPGRGARRQGGSATQAVRSGAQSVRTAVAGAADKMQEQASSLADGIKDRAASVGTAAGNAAASVGDAASGAARSIGDGISGAAGSVGAAASTAADKAREGAGAARDMAAGAASGARDMAADAINQAGKAAQGFGETMQDYSSALGEQMSSTAERARSQATDFAEKAGKQAKSLVAEQPLLVAAFGLAIGALIAAALPRTKAEDDFMGETSDAIKETLGEVAGEQYQKAKEVAGNVAERAKSVAQEEGLTARQCGRHCPQCRGQGQAGGHRNSSRGWLPAGRQVQGRQQGLMAKHAHQCGVTGDVRPARCRRTAIGPSRSDPVVGGGSERAAPGARLRPQAADRATALARAATVRDQKAHIDG